MRAGSFTGVLLSTLVITSMIALAIPLLSTSPVHAALTSHAPIYINGNAGFTTPDPVNGGGSGTENDPYIIENWDISAENANGIEITNTTAHFVIRNSYLHGVNGNLGIRFESVINGIVENNILENNFCGIGMVYSDNNLISGNTFVNDGLLVFDSYRNTVENNTVNRIPLVYLEDKSDRAVTDAGQVILVGCENITVENLNLSNATVGVELWETDNSIVMSNTVENNLYSGIYLISSDKNHISNNIVRNNYNYGIYLNQNSDNNLIENSIVENNWLGLLLNNSDNNLIYHNNFLNNTYCQVYSITSINYWDNGYPSGGNYWSDYTGEDNYRGENQDIPGSDGIGDTPYYIPGDNNQDRYPLMSPVVVKPRLYIVYDIGGRGDMSFNDMACMGGRRAEQELGVELVEMHSTTEADYVPNLRAAALDPNAELIVGVGYLLSEALATVAQEFPDKNFIGIDTYARSLTPTPLPNLMDVVFEEHKGSALVGALAAMLAYHYEKPYVGAVLGIEIPVLWKFEIGYKWGAEYWAPTWYKQRFGEWPPMVDTLWTYTGTFSDITEGYEAAKPMYENGAVAVYNIAGPLGLGINQAVKEIAEAENLEDGPPFWIGVDADQDWINPGFVIASMMKRVDRGVYYATQLVMENKFREAVEEYGNQITLGICTTVLGVPMEGISVSTLDDLDAFIEMGIEAGIIGPENRDAIYEKVRSMRDNQPTWIWEAVAELENKIRAGEVEVPMVMTGDAIAYWRGVFGKLPAPAHIESIQIGTTTVDARDETDTTVKINTDQAGSVTVIKYENNPGGPHPSGFTAIGKYVEVRTDIPSENIAWPIEIRIYYTDEEVAEAGIPENSLRIFYWDGSNWVEEPDSGVDVENNYIWARVTHLSIFAPMGSHPAKVVIYPTADVYAFGEYGIGYSRTQLKFDISGILLHGRILSAKLWLYRQAADGWDGGVALNRVDNQLWGENITASEFDSQTLMNEETCAGKFTSHGWGYLDVPSQLNADYEVGNTYTSFRLRWANDNGSEPSIGIDDGRFLMIDSSSFSLFFASSEYDGIDPYLEVIYVPPYAVSVSISPNENSGVPGQTLTYTMIVRNTGNLDDNYILTVSDNSGWGPNVSPTPLFVASGSTGEATLTVTVPENAKFCTIDNITVTATSQSDNTVSDNAWCLAHAAMVRGVRISISPSYQSDLPGENLEYTVTVRNLGNVDDNYDLIAQDNENWGLGITSSIMAPAFENRMTTLTVTIPDNATGCTKDNVTVAATSQADNTVSGNGSCTAHVLVVRGVEVLLEPKSRFGAIGEDVVFTVTVKNTGNVWDNYKLENNDDAGWPLKLDDDYLEIPKNENRKTKLTVSVPDNENLVCITDNIIVVATAVDNAEVTDNDTVTVHAVSPWTGTATFRLENLYKVSLEKDLQLNTGSKLVAKFYKYDNVTSQAESIIDNFVPPKTIKENENVPHPSGLPVEIVRLVLTTDDTENVISTIASFIATRSVLASRYLAIKLEYIKPGADKPALADEYLKIKTQYIKAPS